MTLTIIIRGEIVIHSGLSQAEFACNRNAGVTEMAGYPTDIEQYIKSKVANGEFNSEDAFICEATRLYREIESRHSQLKSDVQTAVDEVRAGNSSPLDIDAIKEELSNEIDEQGTPF